MGIRTYRDRLAADPEALALHQAEVARMVAAQARSIEEERRSITAQSRLEIRALWRRKANGGGLGRDAAPRASRLTEGKLRRWAAAHPAEAAALLLEASRRDPALRERLKAEIP